MRTSVEELRKRIHERQLETANEDRFLPDVALSEVITEQVVVDVISSSSIPRHEQKDHLIEFVLHDARKIFCILVWIREVPFIDSFFRSREVDPRLPFKLEYLVEIGVSGTAAREFVTRQWDYIAPVFDNGTRRLELRHILPFKSVKGIPNAVGGYGAVRQVELYNAHQKLVAGSSTGAGTVILALKELKADGRQDDFEKERSVLELIGNRRHPHIIELLGSFYTKNSFNFLFPLAEGDLGKLLTNGRPGFWPEERFYKSIVGLASALNHIHFFTYRSKNGETLPYKVFHHDLKPANILIQQERLILADFGISKFKDGNMDSATRFTRCTAAYAPPESLNPNSEDLGDPLVGRGIDMWAFGCILSELATFMIDGSKGVELYKEARWKSVVPGERDACFFDSSTEVRVEVKEWLGGLKAKHPRDTNMQKLLGYITKIMDPNPKSRPNAKKALEMVSGLHPRAANELASLLLRRGEPTLPSPAPRTATAPYMSTYPQQTPPPLPPPQQSPQPRPVSPILPPQYMPTLPPPPLQQSPQPYPVSPILPPQLSQYMSAYPQQTPPPLLPPQWPPQPHPVGLTPPLQYVLAHPQQTPSPHLLPQQPSQPHLVGLTPALQYVLAHPQQTPSPPLPPQQPPQPRPRAQRQTGPAPASKPKPKPAETIASIEAKLEALNKALSKIGEKKAAREKERKALGPRRQKMGEQKYQNEYGRLTNAINGLERQRKDEVAKKDKLLVELNRAKA